MKGCFYMKNLSAEAWNYLISELESPSRKGEKIRLIQHDDNGLTFTGDVYIPRHDIASIMSEYAPALRKNLPPENPFKLELYRQMANNILSCVQSRVTCLTLYDSLLVGQKIRHWREERRMSQAECALRIGVRQPMLSRWENGIVSEVPIRYLCALASVLGVSLADFIVPSDPE